ncbi:Protein kinase C signaling pathway involved MAPKK protein [Malassezia pachydermatis]
MGQPYTITSDVWSLGVTILELALNRYPFTEDGEPPMGPIDLLTFLLNSPLPTLKDDPERGVRWSRSLRDLVERCLIRDGTKRDSIRVLLQHPLVKRAELIPNTDMARFVAKVWNWPVPEM